MSATKMPTIPATDITSFVLEHASEHADKAALIDGPSGRTITYGELDNATQALAGGLAGIGVEPGDRVSMYMPNLPEYAVIFHGTIRAGGVVVTANPLYTAGELRHQITDAEPKVLFTVPPFLEIAKEAAADSSVEQIVLVGGEEEGALTIGELLASGNPAPSVEIDPTSIAVLPYSSGTTGLPKGVMLTHRNLIANLLQIADVLPMTEEDTVIGVLPFFHIYGMQVIMNMGLRVGGTVVTMPRFDLPEFLSLLERHSVTGVYVVPPIALALAKHPAVDEHDLSSIRMIMSGAAPLGIELTEQVMNRLGVPLIQGYGMTELSPVSHLCPLEKNKPGTIGPAVPGAECKIVDPETLEGVPSGERGELWIRGPLVMKGYLNNEKATAETITSDGWLRTGDIAIVDEDGFYTIVDRLKELIKYNGFQVPPAELEAILLGHEKIADAAVIGVPDEEAGELPKAFIVTSGDITDDEVFAYVAEKVSPQKRLRMIERIDEIPKAASGKILRRILRDR